MHRGYIKSWRRAQDSEYFSMGLKHIGLFELLKLKANWKTGYFMGRKINPGQYATSIINLAERTGEHRNTVRRILKDFEKLGMIITENCANRYTIITICNWDTYQNDIQDDLPTGGATAGRPRDSKVY